MAQTKKPRKIVDHKPMRNTRAIIPKNTLVGSLTVLEYHSTLVTQIKNGRIIYIPKVLCECNCGNKIIKSLHQIKQRIGLSCDNLQCKRDWWKVRKMVKGEEE